MIKVKKNIQIKIIYTANNLVKPQTILLKLYKKQNVLNGSWKWLNDNKVTSFMDKGHHEHTLSDQLNYFEKISRSKKDILFAIYFRRKHIGNVGLHQINDKLKTAQFGIIIGNTNYHNMGIGKQVWSEIMKFGFLRLNLKRVYTMIASKNIASTKIAKNLGFKKMKMKFFFKKNNIQFDYPKYYITQKLFKKKII